MSTLSLPKGLFSHSPSFLKADEDDTDNGTGEELAALLVCT
jgi:hypothetical protein